MTSTEAVFDPGSFKDPEGRVCLAGDNIYRTLNKDAADRMAELSNAGVLENFANRGLLIPSHLVSADEAGLDPAIFGATLLHHQRIPLLSYPFEWSFEMLRDAALTTIDLIECCLDRDLILKDATAYNLAPHRGRMVFFDTLSIDRYTAGAPWEAYAQFCREFLFPLMLTAHRGIEFQSWFRGLLNGIGLDDMVHLLRSRDFLKRGVLRHVLLQWKLEKSFGDRDVTVRDRFDKSTFSKDLIRTNLRNIRTLIEKLHYRPAHSEWIDYVGESSYSDDDTSRKSAFVANAMDRIAPRRVVDLGCNTGVFSLIAAKRADWVAAVDIDAACIDALYRRLRADGQTNVVPMVGDLLNPTPAMGWNLTQRQSLFDRIGCDAFLALALVHHICIGGNVPLEACLDQLRDIAPAGVIEWVGKDDAMVKQMLRNRNDVFANYHWDHFERLLRERFTLADVQESHGGARKLCLLMAKDT
jgi:SAM-dependent methyltransferase